MNKTKSNNSQESNALNRKLKKVVPSQDKIPDNTQMNKTNQRIEELKKGCGKERTFWCYSETKLAKEVLCGNKGILCKMCKAKLEATTQTLKEVEEVIDKYLENFNTLTPQQCFLLEELRKELGMEMKQ